jgi:hypothetical protein
MRLVTWNLGHPLDGCHAIDAVMMALSALEPDVAILTAHLAGPAHPSFLLSLAGVGLTHQLPATKGQRGHHVVIASRLELRAGSLGADLRDDRSRPPNALHAYAPAGLLDGLGVRSPAAGGRAVRRRGDWPWLVRAATAMKDRRAVLIGDFDAVAGGERADAAAPLRHFSAEGWTHAVPADGASYHAASGQPSRLDHAYLSPSLNKIDARYAVAAAGFRLSGSRDALSDQPALVVDLQ